MKRLITGVAMAGAIGLLSTLLTLSPTTSQAQDIHFSQFYNSPLTLNPATTGHFEGLYRLVGNYRRQWASIPGTSLFETYAASADMEIRNNLIKTGKLAGGLMLFQDKSGLSKLTNQSVYGSMAYHIPVEDKKHHFGVGVQVGYVTKKIDYSSLTFNNQFDGNVFNPTLPTGETGNGLSMNYLDIQAGVLWTSILKENLKVWGGISAFHLNQPTETFYQNSNSGNKLESRFVVHASAEYGLSETVTIVPSVVMMNQSRAQEINIGGDVTYMLVDGKLSESVLYFGSWFRMSAGNTIVDAIIPKVGLKYKQWKVGLNYDINVSSLNQASQYQGGPEIAIIYIGDLTPTLPVNPVLPCIRY